MARSLETPSIPLQEIDESLNSFSFDFFGTMVKIVLVLVIIIIMIILLIRVLSQKRSNWMSNRAIRTIATLALGQNKSLQVVEIGHSIYLIGVGDNVQLIEKIDDVAEVQHIIDSYHTQHIMPGGTLVQQLSSWLQKLRKTRQNDEVDEITASFQEVFNSKMKSLSNRNHRVEELLDEDTNIDRSNDK